MTRTAHTQKVHPHLWTTTDAPVKDFMGLRRDQIRESDAPGSASSGSVQDPYGTQAAKQQTIGAATLLEGAIEYVIPGTYCYRVVLDGNLGRLICGDTTSTPSLRSVHSSVQHTVGSRVLVLKSPGMKKGTIITVLPAEVLDSQYDQSFLASGIGRFHVTNRQYVKNALRSPDLSRGIPSYSHGQMLLDGTLIQESARAIHSVKHVNIRSFKRIRSIDDPQGDDAAMGLKLL